MNANTGKAKVNNDNSQVSIAFHHSRRENMVFKGWGRGWILLRNIKLLILYYTLLDTTQLRAGFWPPPQHVGKYIYDYKPRKYYR